MKRIKIISEILTGKSVRSIAEEAPEYTGKRYVYLMDDVIMQNMKSDEDDIALVIDKIEEPSSFSSITGQISYQDVESTSIEGAYLFRTFLNISDIQGSGDSIIDYFNEDKAKGEEALKKFFEDHMMEAFEYEKNFFEDTGLVDYRDENYQLRLDIESVTVDETTGRIDIKGRFYWEV